MTSESQKTASAKWNKKNLTTIGCRITKKKKSQFQKACVSLNKTMHSVLMEAVDETIKKAGQ